MMLLQEYMNSTTYYHALVFTNSSEYVSKF
jgi:hypothetical protein